jgi:hypothetical protein
MNDIFASAFANNASVGVRTTNADAEARRAAFMHAVPHPSPKAKRGPGLTSSSLTAPPIARGTRPIAPAPRPARSAGKRRRTS